MKVLLMCDARVGNAIAAWLLENHSEDMAAVVTLSENEVYNAARNMGIPSFVYVSEAQILADLRALPRFDIGILAWWPKLISSEVISIPKQGFINTHPSMLPYNRGKHYNFWALVEQSPFGVSLHFVDEGIDSGDIVAQLAIPYDWEDTGETLYAKASKAMVDLFQSTYPRIRIGDIQRVPQDQRKGTLHFAKEIDAVSQIDLDKTYTAREFLNILRARTFPGYPACSFSDDEETYEIRVNIKRKSV